MLKELFSYMKQYKKYAWISLACIAVECIFELVIPLIMADMVDVGIANGDQDYILHKGLVMIGCAGLALVLGICSARFCALCGQGFGANLREAEYRKLQSYSFSNIDHFQVSSLVTRLTSDVTVIQNSVSTGIRPLCRAPVMLFMATGSAFVINARLALVFLVALPVLGFLLFEIVSHVGPLYTKMQTGIDRVNRIVQENLTAVRVVRSYVRENYEQAKVDFDAAVETKESYQLCLDIYELYQESSMKADGDRYLEAAVKIESKTTEDYYNIGCAYYYLEEQDEAVKAFSKAMKDGSSAAMEMLGEVYLSNGQNDEAKALFSSYLSTDGFAAAANNGLALCALAENDTDSALSYIEEGLKTAEDSDRENLLFNQIVSYEKRADFDTAKSLMADFLAAYPENTAAQRENTFLQNR